jgi:hypothetical protein
VGAGWDAIGSLSFAQRWDPARKIPWADVKASWEKHWDLSKPVLVEKSPPNLCRAFEIEKHFPECYFVIMTRDPYASCEAWFRRNLAGNWNKRQWVRFWIFVAQCQKANRDGLKRRLFLTYEELTEHPKRSEDRLLAFVPELERLDTGKTFSIHGRSSRLKNLNDSLRTRLMSGEIRLINEELAGNPELLSFFDYRLMEPGGWRDLKAVAARAKWMGERIAAKVAGLSRGGGDGKDL